MSGTSLDGIDLAYIVFKYSDEWTFNIQYAETIPYNDLWSTQLSRLIDLDKEELEKIDCNYTLLLSQVINEFITKNNITDIDAVCSHGHTAIHQPDKGFTYQIGNREELAELIKHKVVCDFRVQDVMLGGQGAPLVPIGDALLFYEYDFCMNLGGFANISFNDGGQRIAFDICPVNIVLNRYAQKIGLAYDSEGKMASTGKLHMPLLEALNALDFYKQNFPKSLGLEWVESTMIPVIESYSLDVKDILRTVLEHMAIQMAFIFKDRPKASVLISGGGAYNTFLINRIKVLTDHDLVIPSSNIIEFKEALIFGFLGVLRMRGEVNCLASVTGATKDHSSGKIFTYEPQL